MGGRGGRVRDETVNFNVRENVTVRVLEPRNALRNTYIYIYTWYMARGRGNRAVTYIVRKIISIIYIYHSGGG